MTIHQTLLALMEDEVFVRMSLSAQKMVVNCLDGLDGYGENVPDHVAREHLSTIKSPGSKMSQVEYIQKIAKRYLAEKEDKKKV